MRVDQFSDKSARAWLELAAPGETEVVEGVEGAGQAGLLPLLHPPVLQHALHQHAPPPRLTLASLHTEEEAVAGGAEAVDSFTGVITSKLGVEGGDGKSPARQLVGGAGWQGDLPLVVIPAVQLGSHRAPQSQGAPQLPLHALPVPGGGKVGRLAGGVQAGLAQQEEEADQHLQC